MANDSNKPLSSSVKYTIGGKTYDASRLQSQNKQVTTVNSTAFAPRQVSKPLENQSGVIHTNANKPSVESQPKVVQSFQQGTIQTSVNKNTPNTPATSVSVNSVSKSPNMQTGSQMDSVAQTSVQAQTNFYNSTNAYSTERKHISSEINKMPRNVDAVKTGYRVSESARFKSINEMGNREYFRGVGASAKYTVSTEAVSALKDWKGSTGTSLVTGGKIALGKAESSLASSDDLGTQAAGGAVGAVMLGAGGFKTAQATSGIVVDGVKTVGNGIYHVSTTAGLAKITVGKTADIVIRNQVAPLSKEAISIFKTQSRRFGLNDTVIVKGIVNRVDSVKTAVNNAKNTVKGTGRSVAGGVKAIYHTVDRSIKIVHGVSTGSLTVDAAKLSLDALKKSRDFITIKNGVKTGIRTGASYAVRGTAKGASVAAFRGVPKATRFLKNGVMTAAGAMAASEDLGTQAVGTAVIATEVGVKTAVVGKKATGYTIKTAVKGGKSAYKGVKGVYAGVKYIREFGLKTAWKNYSSKLMLQIGKAGKSVVSAIFAGLKLLASKYLVPLLLIVAVLIVSVSGISSIVSFIGSIFGGTFYSPDTKTEYDIREYLSEPTTGVPNLSLNYRQALANQMQESYNSYDIVRFYSNTGSSDAIEPTLEGVTTIFPTDEELINMLQAIFNALLLKEYELEATEAEAAALIDELFNGLFRITTVTSVEYCGQSLETGEGTATVHGCGSIHALADCPNKLTGTHTIYTCDTCDSHYYTCKGHQGYKNCGKSEHVHDESENGCFDETGKKTCGKDGHSHKSWYSASNSGCYSTTYHNGELSYDCGNSTKNFKCSGYTYCGSHDVISYILTLDGVYALEEKYYNEPINSLLNINPRTSEQEQELQELQGYYDIFKELMSHVAKEYGGGLSMEDLSGVQFVNGSRTGNQSVVNLALSQVGQQGGQPYWSYYGFQSRVEWCACFVNWCMRKTPSASPSYPTTANNAYCPTIANHFKSMGQWGDRNYTNLVAGDTIFFDWEGDGVTDHIGIVIGHDGTTVYTVEGNSGDAVRVRQYSIGSSVIYGYGLMNY